MHLHASLTRRQLVSATFVNQATPVPEVMLVTSAASCIYINSTECCDVRIGILLSGNALTHLQYFVLWSDSHVSFDPEERCQILYASFTPFCCVCSSHEHVLQRWNMLALQSSKVHHKLSSVIWNHVVKLIVNDDLVTDLLNGILEPQASSASSSALGLHSDAMADHSGKQNLTDFYTVRRASSVHKNIPRCVHRLQVYAV